MFKKEEGLTYIAMIFIIIFIALIVFGAIYFVRMQISKEALETLKTNLLLIQGKTELVSQHVDMKEKDAKLTGTKLTDMKEDEVIKAFLEKQIIDSESKDSDFYVLTQQDLRDLELENIKEESGMYYIVDYKNNDIITTKGYTAIDGQTYYKLTDIEKLENDLIGILKIEKIGLKATVKEGSNSKILKDYIGHIEGTSLYDGNICLAAHNRGNKYSYFARLNELKNGDIVKYTTNFYTREYKINSIKTIFETDLTILENTNENKITMITCIKNKRNQRLCVQAVQI